MAQWLLLIGRAPFPDAERLDPASLTPIVPPPDRFWADPFIWSRDGRCWVFVEELPFDTRIGRISVLELDDSLRPMGSSTPVLDEPRHLSYPYLFEYSGELFMVPESAGSGRIDCYRCVAFPAPLDPRAEPDDRVEGRRCHPVRARRGVGGSCAPPGRPGPTSTAHCSPSTPIQPLTDRWTPAPRQSTGPRLQPGAPGRPRPDQGRRPADSSRPGFGAPLRSRAAPDGDRAADPRWIRGAGDLARYGSQLRGLARHASSGLARGDPGHGRPAPAPP